MWWSPYIGGQGESRSERGQPGLSRYPEPDFFPTRIQAGLNHLSKLFKLGTMAEKEFNSIAEFYPFYLSEHQNRTSRRLNLIGSSLGLLLALYALFSWQWQPLIMALVLGYGLAWIGHFCLEKNKPATFKHPVYSFCCDWIMYKDILTGRIPF